MIDEQVSPVLRRSHAVVSVPGPVQHEHVSEWAHLLRLDQPPLDPVAARIRVHAVLSVAHDTARTAHLHRDPAVPAAVVVRLSRPNSSIRSSSSCA